MFECRDQRSLACRHKSPNTDPTGIVGRCRGGFRSRGRSPFGRRVSTASWVAHRHRRREAYARVFRGLVRLGARYGWSVPLSMLSRLLAGAWRCGIRLEVQGHLDLLGVPRAAKAGRRECQRARHAVCRHISRRGLTPLGPLLVRARWQHVVIDRERRDDHRAKPLWLL